MDNRCEFLATSEPRVYRCRRCGFTTQPTRYEPSQIRRACRAWDPRRSDDEHTAQPAQRGLGDAVAWWIDKLSIGRLKERSKCGCKRRREWLNKWMPFRRERPPGISEVGSNGTVEPKRVLLRFPHGLGDAVQLTSVLLHLRALRPHWMIDVEAKPGAASLFSGLARRVFVTGRQAFVADDYDLVHTLAWEEPSEAYRDSPSTKAERCLREVFSIAPQPQWCRYHVGIGSAAMERARTYLQSIAPFSETGMPGRFRVVVMHYQGNSARRRKNVDEQAMRAAVDSAVKLGYVTVLLDFETPPRSGLLREPLPHWPVGAVVSPGGDHPLWQGLGTGDGETLAALIAQAALFVGIDSGPAHIAGATNTPSVVIWTGHHPIHYFGLAENTLHLVPGDHEELLRGDRDAGKRYFEAHYRHRTYRDARLAVPRIIEEHLRPAETSSPGTLVMDGDHWVRAGYRAADMVIVRDIAWNDAYRLGELRLRPRTVLDVGAHIGCFATIAHRRWPLAEIACVEPNPDNLNCLRENAGAFATIVPDAVTYTSGPLTLVSSIFLGSDNTGGSYVVEPGSAAPVGAAPTFVATGRTIEEILLERGWDAIDLLKFDCEGCEFSVLEQTPSLAKIGAIVGEYHDRLRFERLIQSRFQGWEIRWLSRGEPGLFWLLNPAADVPRE